MKEKLKVARTTLNNIRGYTMGSLIRSSGLTVSWLRMLYWRGGGEGLHVSALIQVGQVSFLWRIHNLLLLWGFFLNNNGKDMCFDE